MNSFVITPRDREVLDLLEEGLGNQEIAERLSIAPRTVKAHIGKLCLRAGITEGRKRVVLLNLLNMPQLDQNRLIELTPQLRRVVEKVVVDGKTNSQIAADLGVKEDTIKVYLSAIFDKIGASTRLELRKMVTL
jgi:DNA-binding NarL/FixJ family response regulator